MLYKMNMKLLSNKITLIIVVCISLIIIFSYLILISFIQPSSLNQNLKSDIKVEKQNQKERNTFTGENIQFEFPNSYKVIETSKNVYFLADDKHQYIDQSNIHILSEGKYYDSFEAAIDRNKSNLENFTQKDINNGVIVSGTQKPGAMGGNKFTLALIRFKPGPIIIELIGNDPAEKEAFDMIVSTLIITGKNNTLETYGYEHSSGTLFSGGTEYHIGLFSNFIKNLDDLGSSFSCIDVNQKISGIKGNFSLIMQKDLSASILDTLDIGEQVFSYDIEQDGRFTSQTLLTNPKYTVFELAFRRSCNQNEILFFGVDPRTEKLIKYDFFRKNGIKIDMFLIPAGKKIPQQDKDLNLIYDVYNQSSGKRDKIRFKFYPQENAFYEIESWSQDI